MPDRGHASLRVTLSPAPVLILVNETILAQIVDQRLGSLARSIPEAGGLKFAGADAGGPRLPGRVRGWGSVVAPGTAGGWSADIERPVQSVLDLLAASLLSAPLTDVKAVEFALMLVLGVPPEPWRVVEALHPVRDGAFYVAATAQWWRVDVRLESAVAREATAILGIPHPELATQLVAWLSSHDLKDRLAEVQSEPLRAYARRVLPDEDDPDPAPTDIERVERAQRLADAVLAATGGLRALAGYLEVVRLADRIALGWLSASWLHDHWRPGAESSAQARSWPPPEDSPFDVDPWVHALNHELGVVTDDVRLRCALRVEPARGKAPKSGDDLTPLPPFAAGLGRAELVSAPRLLLFAAPLEAARNAARYLRSRPELQMRVTARVRPWGVEVEVWNNVSDEPPASRTLGILSAALAPLGAVQIEVSSPAVGERLVRYSVDLRALRFEGPGGDHG